MKLFSCIVVLLSCINSALAQSTDIGKFINDMDTIFIPSDFQYFNLLDSSYRPQFDKFTIPIKDESAEQFVSESNDFNMDEFIQKAKNAPILNWVDYKIENARIYSYKDIPKNKWDVFLTAIYAYDHIYSRKKFDSIRNSHPNSIYIRVCRNWSKDKINGQVKKARKKWEASTPKEDQKFFTFSTPIFSNDKNYAMVSFRSQRIEMFYIFKWKEGKWTKIWNSKRYYD